MPLKSLSWKLYTSITPIHSYLGIKSLNSEIRMAGLVGVSDNYDGISRGTYTNWVVRVASRVARRDC